MSRLEFRAWDKGGERMLNNIGFHPSICCELVIHRDKIRPPLKED